MATDNSRSTVRPTKGRQAAAPPIHFSYCSATDKVELWTEPPGEGKEDDLGQGLQITWDRTDGRFVRLKLRNVREHLGARPEDRVVFDPAPDLSTLDFDPKGKAKALVVRDLIRFVLEVTGLRVQRTATVPPES
jgi:hypothetical protein